MKNLFSQQSAVPAIQTTYKGFRMRSRLEARWAVFFDAIGLPWDYEREGYVTCAGAAWLPDFVIGHSNLPVEIKPSRHGKENPTQYSDEFSKVVGYSINKGSDYIERDALFIVGSPWEYSAVLVFSGLSVDSVVLNVRFGIGRRDDREVWLVDDSQGFATALVDYGMDDSGRYPLMDHPRITSAEQASKSARFEFGESGATHA